MRSGFRRVGLIAAVWAGATGLTIAQDSGAPLIVTPQQLSRELQDPTLVLLQVGPKEDYEAGHIDGARLIEMHDLATPMNSAGPMLELPSDAELRERLEHLGISDNSRIVVIPGADWGSPATRIVWTLQAAGFGARTRLLDGGSAAWRRAGLPTTTSAPRAATRGRITVASDRSIAVDHNWMQAHLTSPRIRIIDGRAPVFYEGPGMPAGRAAGGRERAAVRAGHLPGAKNIPFNTLMDDSMRVLPRDELRRIFAAAGVQPGDTVVGYCHIGQQATVVLFAARLLGHPVKLYDGSYTDWANRKLPVENRDPGKAPEGGK